jgi:hypothetical protein
MFQGESHQASLAVVEGLTSGNGSAASEANGIPTNPRSGNGASQAQFMRPGDGIWSKSVNGLSRFPA